MNAKGVSYRRLQRTFFVTGLIMLVALVYSAPRATAQDRAAHQMKFTTCEPVEFPGRVLKPGTYYIRRDMPPLRSGTDAMIKVLDESRQHVLVSTVAIAASRLQNTQGESLIFYEAPAGTPRPVRSWYLPGDVLGYDFVYPKGHLEQIAAALHPTAPSTAEVTYSPLPAAEAEVQPEAPAPPVVEENPPEQPPVQQAEEVPAPAPTTLPKTAGELPLLLLLGCLALLASSVLRLERQVK